MLTIFYFKKKRQKSKRNEKGRKEEKKEKGKKKEKRKRRKKGEKKEKETTLWKRPPLKVKVHSDGRGRVAPEVGAAG